MIDVKLCKDCKFYIRKWFQPDQCERTRWLEKHFDLIRGKETTKVNFKRCDNQRSYQHCCGPEAKFFEPRLKGDE